MAGADRQLRPVLYGSLIMAALVAFAALVFVLDDIRQAFVRSYTIVAIFPKAPDLNVDARVLVAGRYAGRVTEVALLPMGYDTIPMVSVRMELPFRVQQQVRRDSQARLTSVTMLGQRVVDISPGSAGLPVLAHGDTIAVFEPQQRAELMARVTHARAALDTLERAAAALRAPLAARMAAFDPLRRELAGARAEVARLRRDFETGPGATAYRDPELRAGLQRVRAHVDEIGAAVARATGTTEGAGAELRGAIADLSGSVQELAAGIDTLQARVDDPAGFAGRLRQDTAIQLGWRGTHEELDSLVAAVRQNPFRYFRLRLW